MNCSNWSAGKSYKKREKKKNVQDKGCYLRNIRYNIHLRNEQIS